MIKFVDGTSSAHSFNPYAYFGHSWSYFDIQNLRLVILIFIFALDSLSDVSLIFIVLFINMNSQTGVTVTFYSGTMLRQIV